MFKRPKKIFKNSRFVDPKLISFVNQLKIRNENRYQPGFTSFLGRKVYYADSTSFIAGVNEIFKGDIYKFKPDSKSPLILDCGANIGLATIYLKNLYPGSRIVAFEPDQAIAKIYQQNIESFEFQNVDLHAKAVWIEETVLNFKEDGGFSGRLVDSSEPTNIDQISQVETISLLEFLDQQVDLLKIDIEGAETEVLKQIAPLLKNVKNMFIEYHSEPDKPQTLQEILQILSESGFRYQIQEAFVSPSPFWEIRTMVDMDLQLNVFAYRV